jgi:hypothetical protein
VQTSESFVASALPKVVALEQLWKMPHLSLVRVAGVGLSCFAMEWLAWVYQDHWTSDQPMGSWWVSRICHLAQLAPHLQDLLVDVAH